MSPVGRAIKRVIDIVAAATMLLAGWPVLAAIAAAVRLGSPGPALFRQERAGRGGKPFVLYKFRTLRADADPFAESPRDGADPRLTRVGRWLRETSLDELPQLWNVLVGDMSLVGPRPLYMSQAAAFTEREARRLQVRPGITGLAQVQGRGELPHREKLELDVQYVERAGLWLDLVILWRTAAGLLGRKRIYQRW